MALPMFFLVPVLRSLSWGWLCGDADRAQILAYGAPPRGPPANSINTSTGRADPERTNADSPSTSKATVVRPTTPGTWVPRALGRPGRAVQACAQFRARFDLDAQGGGRPGQLGGLQHPDLRVGPTTQPLLRSRCGIRNAGLTDPGLRPVLGGDGALRMPAARCIAVIATTAQQVCPAVPAPHGRLTPPDPPTRAPGRDQDEIHRRERRRVPCLVRHARAACGLQGHHGHVQSGW